MQLLTYSILIFYCSFTYYQCLSILPDSESAKNPEENPGIYQGDIVVQPVDDRSTGRGVAIRSASQRWPRGVVPYEFAPNISANHTALIVQQMRAMENMTMVNNTQCIRFREKNATDQFFIIIFNGSGCYAPVGSWGTLVRVRGVSLMHGQSSSCMVSGIIQHELMHVLGFYHEQSRPDRDSYVSIQWANIDPSQVSAFERYNDSTVDTQVTSYDYGSVMHYGWNAFAVNTSIPTIITTQNATASIGQRVRLSPIDIIEIQRYYNCVATPPRPTTTTTTTTTRTTSMRTTSTSVTTITVTTTASTTVANRSNHIVVCTGFPTVMELFVIFLTLIIHFFEILRY